MHPDDLKFYNAVKNGTPEFKSKLTDADLDEYERIANEIASDTITDKVQSSPMSSAELEQFYKENPDLRDDLLKYAPSLPSVQANAENPFTASRGSGSGDALTDIWKGLTDEESISQKGTGAVGEYIHDNPGKSLALVGSAFMPLSWAGLAGAVSLGAGGEALDKTHPTTSEQSEYVTKTPVDNFTDIAGGALVNVLGHGTGMLVNRGVTGLLAPTIARDAKIAEVIAKNAKNEEILNHLGIAGGANGAGEGMGAPSYIRARIGKLIAEERPDIVKAYKTLPREREGLAGLGDELDFMRVLEKDAKTPINAAEISRIKSFNETLHSLNRRLEKLGKPLQSPKEVPAPIYKNADVEIPDYEIAKRYAELKTPIEVPKRLGFKMLPNSIYNNAPDFIQNIEAIKNNLAVPDALNALNGTLSRTANLGAGLTGQLLKNRLLDK